MTSSDDRDIAQRQAQLDSRQAAKGAPRQIDLLGEQAPPGGLKPVHLAIGAVALASVLALVLWTLSGKTVTQKPAASAPAELIAAPPPSPAPANEVQIDLSSSPPPSAAPTVVAPEQLAPAPAPTPVLQAAPQPHPLARPGVRRDAWLCVHGDQNDYRTIAACDRKDAALGRGGE